MTPAIALLRETLEKAQKKNLVEGKGAWQHAKDEAKKRGKPESYAAAIAAKICGKSAALDILHDTLEKAGEGEGSRGGHIIGHTKSGKPIYSSDSGRRARVDKKTTPDEHEEHQKAHENAIKEDPFGNKHRNSSEAVYQHASRTGKYEAPIGKTSSGKDIHHPYSEKHKALHASGSDAKRISEWNSSSLHYNQQDHQDAYEVHKKAAKDAHKKGNTALAQHHERLTQTHSLAPEKGAIEETRH